MSEQDWIERLRSDDIAVTRYPTHPHLPFKHPLWPLLCDVVEAAEFGRGNPHMPSDLRWEDFDAALAALRAEVEK